MRPIYTIIVSVILWISVIVALRKVEWGTIAEVVVIAGAAIILIAIFWPRRQLTPDWSPGELYDELRERCPDCWGEACWGDCKADAHSTDITCLHCGARFSVTPSVGIAQRK